MKTANVSNSERVFDLVLDDSNHAAHSVNVYSFNDHKVIVGKSDSQDLEGSEQEDFSFTELYEKSNDYTVLLGDFTQMQPLSISDQELLEAFMECYQNTLAQYMTLLSYFDQQPDVIQVKDLYALSAALTAIIKKSNFEFVKRRNLRKCVKAYLIQLTAVTQKYRKCFKSSISNSNRCLEAYLFPIVLGGELQAYHLKAKHEPKSIDQSEDNLNYVSKL